MSYHEVPDETFGEFLVQAQGRCDFMVDVIPITTDQGRSMVICAKEGAIYVSREQAKAFFGLIEPIEPSEKGED